MDSLREKIDKSFTPYDYKTGVEELFIRYKKRKKRKRAVVTSLAAVCMMFFVLIVAESTALLKSSRSKGLGLSVSAFSIDTPTAELGAEKKLIADSGGVLKQSRKVAYDKNGKEIAEREKAYNYGSRTIVTPYPLTLKISGDEVESFRVECSSNGSLYNNRNDNIESKKLSYKENKSVLWIPNCDKLTAEIGAEDLKIPSTLEDDKRISKKLESLLKTEEDYNRYFGDIIKITAECKDKSEETVSVRITLDEKGRYYISEG